MPSMLGLVLILAAACAGADQADGSKLEMTSSTAPTTSEPTTGPTSDGRPSAVDHQSFVEPLALMDTDDDRRESTDGSGGSPATSAGSPATTAPARGTSDPFTVYRGLLGTLGIDDVLFGSPAAPPVVPAGAAPLTGLPVSVPDRRAVVVKIDNSPPARPQLGLNAADLVFEEEVEGGITRLAAVFHTNTAVVGPVRSGRTTDISFVNALGSPALAYSGANTVIDALLLRQETVLNFSAARSSGYWRDRSRRAPSNLFTDIDAFTGSGSSPPAQFAYGKPTDGPPVGLVTISYPATSVRWSWTGSDWIRHQNGSAHVTDGGAQVSAANVVVAVVPEVLTGLVDSTGEAVPEYVFAGQGPVSVFSSGRRIDGTWTRPSLRSPAIMVDHDGNVIELTPGRTWVELVTAGTYSAA